ncbi:MULTISPECIES: hypothetical protein [unclassified Sphingomonas]|jgi:hypothetical protein|nr:MULTISPECIES: hypothetical protein [unclassified Sphingomonas]
MMRRFALAAALCVFAGASAHAQTPWGADMGKMAAEGDVRLDRPEEDADWAVSTAGEARLHALAVCAVKKEPREAGKIVELGFLGERPTPAVSSLFAEANCGARGEEISAGGRFLRWSLIEQLYLADPRVPAAVAANAMASGADGSRALGACVAGRDPVASDAFVRSARRSPAEAAAFKRIVPAINACAGKKKLNLSGAEIHGVLAEGLYKMRGSAARGTN